MKLRTTAFIFIFINSQRIFQGSQAPETYRKCVPQESLGSEVLAGRGTITFPHDNSATRCAFYCKEEHYRFSGTKNKFCLCVNRFVPGLNISTKCKTKCPGDEEETCGGEGSVSIRRAGYMKMTMKTRKVSRSESNITRLPRGNVTDESTGNISSSQAKSNARATKDGLMIAVYISLPVGIIVAGSVVLIVGLLLRRPKSEARVKRCEVSSCYFTPEQGGNILADDDHYQTIDPEISLYAEISPHRITTVNNCDAGYLTPVNSNDTAGYITPIFSNLTVENYTRHVRKKINEPKL